MEYCDLVLDNGELVRIEFPTDVFDEFYEYLDNAMKRKDWWTPLRFEGCTATYMGMILDRVNVSKVVGML